MRLIDILDIIKGHQKVRVSRKQYEKGEDGNLTVIDTTVYEGQLRDWDAKLTDVLGMKVDSVYVFSDDIHITIE